MDYTVMDMAKKVIIESQKVGSCKQVLLAYAERLAKKN